MMSTNGREMKALKMLEKRIGLTMGEVCDPLPCWLVMEVDGIEVLQQSKPRQELEDYVHIVRISGEASPAYASLKGGSFLIHRPQPLRPYAVSTGVSSGATIPT